MTLVALKPRPRLLTLDGLLLHGYIANQETLDYIEEMINDPTNNRKNSNE